MFVLRLEGPGCTFVDDDAASMIARRRPFGFYWTCSPDLRSQLISAALNPVALLTL